MNNVNNPSRESTLLSVDALSVVIDTGEGRKTLLHNIEFDVCRGDSLGIVGESGSGKSMTAKAVLGLLPTNAQAVEGSIVLEGSGNLLQFADSDLRKIRGSRIGAVFQDPMSGLNPVVRIGSQMSWMISAHRSDLSRGEIRARSLEYLALAALPDPRRVHASYPHELSGGMRQRVLIAMALISEPPLLIADEPTTALDVTTQHHVLALLASLRSKFGLTVIFISHDLAVISQMCNRIVVMYSGTIVESGETSVVLAAPNHPYTRGLLDASPSLEAPETDRLVPIPGVPSSALVESRGCAFAPRCSQSLDVELCQETVPKLADHSTSMAACHFPLGALAGVSGDGVSQVSDAKREVDFDSLSSDPDVLLSVHECSKVFRNRGGTPTWAVKGVDLTVHRGAAVGLVGESGSGKTTLSRMILGLISPTDGSIEFCGEDIGSLSRSALRSFRSRVQLVQQNPYSSLNPRMSVGKALSEPLLAHNMASDLVSPRVEWAIDAVGMDVSALGKRPGAFSGGQRQRIAIARALVLQPELLVLDEPVSALDVSVQAQVLHLLQDLQEELGLSYLFVSHDLSVVRYVCSHVFVMKDGEFVEHGTTETVLSRPVHSYTKALLASVPALDLSPLQ